MDYQEAIYCMKVMADEEVCEECNYYQSCDHTKQADMAKIAISAMNELQAIHNNGINLERLKDIDIRKQVVEHINYMEYMDIKDELEEFKQLGTLEEVREAVELQQADKPRILRLSTHGAPYGYLYCCPNCEYRIIIKDHRGSYSGPRTKYCPDCGKRLNWGEEDD